MASRPSGTTERKSKGKERRSEQVFARVQDETRIDQTKHKRQRIGQTNAKGFLVMLRVEAVVVVVVVVEMEVVEEVVVMVVVEVVVLVVVVVMMVVVVVTVDGTVGTLEL